MLTRRQQAMRSRLRGFSITVIVVAAFVTSVSAITNVVANDEPSTATTTSPACDILTLNDIALALGDEYRRDTAQPTAINGGKGEIATQCTYAPRHNSCVGCRVQVLVVKHTSVDNARAEWDHIALQAQQHALEYPAVTVRTERNQIVRQASDRLSTTVYVRNDGLVIVTVRFSTSNLLLHNTAEIAKRLGETSQSHL